MNSIQESNDSLQENNLDSFDLKTISSKINEGSIKKDEFTNFFDNLFLTLKDYTDMSPLKKSYMLFLKEEKESDLKKLKERIINNIGEYISSKQYFKIWSLFSNIMYNLLDKIKIQKKITKIFKNVNKISVISLEDDCINIIDFDQINFMHQISFDKTCKLYQIKKYYDNFQKELIDNEKIIYHTNFKNNDYQSFIVHSKSKISNKIPYYPFLKLNSFLTKLCHKSQPNLFTQVDKIVMIKEIAIGLSELHEHYIYHQNLNDWDIFIDNDQNAYIGNFAYDLNIEIRKTKDCHLKYYWHPNLVENPNSLSIENVPNEQKARYDIYSFGVLIHEIVTTMQPSERIGTSSSKAIIDSLTNEENFDQKYGIIGIKEIILKCISTDPENEYSNVKSIINDIDNLDMYRNNPQIEARIKNAKDSAEYECNLSDIVTNYYLGNDDSKVLLEKFIETCQKYLPSKSISFEKEDILTPILQFFDFNKFECPYDKELIFFEERFDLIIQENVALKYTNNDIYFTSIQKVMKEKSLIASNKLNDDGSVFAVKFSSNMIPITTLGNFFNQFKEYVERNLLIFFFFIVKELFDIHNFDLYHGELTKDSIGIYYNSNTGTFVPLIIPFYVFFKSNQVCRPELKVADLLKNQKQDIKLMKKILKNIDTQNIIPDEFYQQEHLNLMILKLYNLDMPKEAQRRFRENSDDFGNNQYKSYDITFRLVHEIFACKDETDEIHQIFCHFLYNNKEEGYLDVDNSVNEILQFSNHMAREQKNDDEKEIIKKLIQIKRNNDKMFREVHEKEKSDPFDIDIIEDNEKKLITIKKNENEAKKHIDATNPQKFEIPQFRLVNYTDFKMHKFRQMIQNKVSRVRKKTIKISPDLHPFWLKNILFLLNRKIQYKIEFVMESGNQEGANIRGKKLTIEIAEKIATDLGFQIYKKKKKIMLSHKLESID
ncbi:hypothetical protein M9Y10_038499 [Tritrichomonas musculus]|uniref:Protein kinase domain-containing protein n=1 Tax=Tritrichomonas musculus TaxID=1915356 RepID=A0ABR2K8S0_9EUKA